MVFTVQPMFTLGYLSGATVKHSSNCVDQSPQDASYLKEHWLGVESVTTVNVQQSSDCNLIYNCGKVSIPQWSHLKACAPAGKL